MATEKINAPAFDDIVFEDRNKEYGAYKLRKKYSRTVLVALLIGILIISTAIITPYINAKAVGSRKAKAELQVEVQLQNLDTPENVAPPPPPPPPPPADVVRQAEYVPPVVVDTIKPEDVTQLMTADQAQVEVKNEVVEEVQEVKEEVKEAEPEPEIFIIVEEMPSYPGGDAELLNYIAKNTVYPEVAKENNIQGKVIMKFCVTEKGGVSQVSVLKGVDPELDKEAVRVVNTLPTFKPGKQGGKPVKVWFQVPINFRLQ